MAASQKKPQARGSRDLWGWGTSVGGQGSRVRLAREAGGGVLEAGRAGLDVSLLEGVTQGAEGESSDQVGSATTRRSPLPAKAVRAFLLTLAIWLVPRSFLGWRGKQGSEFGYYPE